MRQGMFENLADAGKAQLPRRNSSRKRIGLPPHQLIPQDERYTEAIRSVVAAALQLANPQRSTKTLLVTSSVPGEGKTTLAISFAAYAARIQRRVLLIDLSFRTPIDRGRAWRIRGSGILQVLQGRATGRADKSRRKAWDSIICLCHATRWIRPQYLQVNGCQTFCANWKGAMTAW